MKKRFVSSILGCLLLNSGLFTFSCVASSNDKNETKNDNLIEITQKKDGNFITRTEKEKNIQQGKVINIALNTKDFGKNLADEKLKIILGGIAKVLQKNFNKTYGTKIDNLISNVQLVGSSSNVKNISFEINFYQDIKNNIEKYIKNVFNTNNIEAFKTSLKNMIKINYDKKDCQDAVNEIVKELDEKIQNLKNKKQLTLENKFSFDSIIKDFNKSFSNIFGNNLTQDDEEIEAIQNSRQIIIDNLIAKKANIESYANNNFPLEEINNVIDSIISVNSSGEFSRVSSSLKQVSSQKS